jgi:hypothetical protein
MSGIIRHANRGPAWRDVFAWRIECLRSAGFSRATAEQIAVDPRFDLHALLELVDRGCGPDLAARILAPLESQRQLAGRLGADAGPGLGPR